MLHLLKIIATFAIELCNPLIAGFNIEEHEESFETII